jgi:hypothetical protein
MTTIAMKARLKRVAEKYPESTRGSSASVLTPAILDLMLANPELELGDVLYSIV